MRGRGSPQGDAKSGAGGLRNVVCAPGARIWTKPAAALVLLWRGKATARTPHVSCRIPKYCERSTSAAPIEHQHSTNAMPVLYQRSSNTDAG